MVLNHMPFLLFFCLYHLFFLSVLFLGKGTFLKGLIKYRNQFKHPLGYCLHGTSVWRQQPSRLLPLLVTSSHCSNFPRLLCHLLQTLSLAPSRPLPITCAHAFYICSITSAQYFSFSPLSFIFLLPVLLLLLPPPPSSPVFSAVWVTLNT